MTAAVCGHRTHGRLEWPGRRAAFPKGIEGLLFAQAFSDGESVVIDFEDGEGGPSSWVFNRLIREMMANQRNAFVLSALGEDAMLRWLEIGGDTRAVAERLRQWHRSPPSPNRDNPFTLDRMLSQTLATYESVLLDKTSNIVEFYAT